METSWNVYDYPSPPDDSETSREVNATVTITFSVNEFFPKHWDDEEIKTYIIDNYEELNCDNFNYEVEL